MGRHHHSQSVQIIDDTESDSSDYPPPIRVERAGHNRIVRLSSDHGSHRSKRSHRDSSPAPVVVENYLNVPNARPRASSQGGAPQPNFIPIYLPQPPRSPSRERTKKYYYSSESEESWRSDSRGRRRSSHRPSLSMETQQQLARLKLIEDEKEREAAEEAAVAKYEERQRKQKEREKQVLLEAEAKRKKQEEEDEENRKRIILEEKARADKKKREESETRKRILREEEERVEKEKAKKKKEEEEFQQKVKERFMRAGYSPEYIEDILEKKKEEKKREELAIDLSRPTYIRVRRKHLHPDTLDYYRLPWEYDSSDSQYIIIKKYISHDLQQELFRHTEKIKIRKEERLITDGYTKETITTLKPGIVRDNNKDEMYMVRRKSTSKGPSRSRSVSRRSWMFT